MKDQYYGTFFEGAMLVKHQLDKVNDINRVLQANDIPFSEWIVIDKYLQLYSELQAYISVLQTGALSFVYENLMPNDFPGVGFDDPLVLALKNVLGYMQLTIHKGDKPIDVINLIDKYRVEVVSITQHELANRQDLQRHKSFILRAVNSIIGFFTGRQNTIKPQIHKTVTTACAFFARKTGHDSVERELLCRGENKPSQRLLIN